MEIATRRVKGERYLPMRIMACIYRMPAFRWEWAAAMSQMSTQMSQTANLVRNRGPRIDTERRSHEAILERPHRDGGSRHLRICRAGAFAGQAAPDHRQRHRAHGSHALVVQGVPRTEARAAVQGP